MLLAPLVLPLLLPPAPQPVPPAPRAAPGAELSLQAILSGGMLRWYRVYVPTDYDPSVPVPVLFAFHGGGANATHASEAYGIVEEAEERGWIAVFPEGTGEFGGPPFFLFETWNAGDCCTYAMENGIDDVGFFVDLLAKLSATYAVDPGAVFSTGMSNGAMMTYRLAVEVPELLTAIAPVSGALLTAPPTTPLPVLAIHGLLDEAIPFAGGSGSGPATPELPSQLETILPFFAVNGGALPAAPLVQGPALLFASGPPSLADTWYFLALDGGHTWPGQIPSPLQPNEPLHTGVPATPLMFDFFELQLLR
ncbi:MAG: PHB depolymerase family esterase [Planctomycetota bacterium]